MQSALHKHLPSADEVAALSTMQVVELVVNALKSRISTILKR